MGNRVGRVAPGSPEDSREVPGSFRRARLRLRLCAAGGGLREDEEEEEGEGEGEGERGREGERTSRTSPEDCAFTEIQTHTAGEALEKNVRLVDLGLKLKGGSVGHRRAESEEDLLKLLRREAEGGRRRRESSRKCGTPEGGFKEKTEPERCERGGREKERERERVRVRERAPNSRCHRQREEIAVIRDVEAQEGGGVLVENSLRADSLPPRGVQGRSRGRYEATGIVLGRGNFGVVTVWVDRLTGERRACKSVARSRAAADVEREIALMRRVGGHPNICALEGVYRDGGVVHMLMELCAGGSLSSHILRRKRFPEEEAAGLFRQIAEGVRHMHAQGVMHRDLKPENILLVAPPDPREPHRTRVKLCDFGLAVYLEPRQRTRGIAGSPFYFAPEVVNGGKYGKEADMWSLGVVLYVLLSGMLPFFGDSDSAIFERIRAAKVRFAARHWGEVSPAARRLVRKLLVGTRRAASLRRSF